MPRSAWFAPVGAMVGDVLAGDLVYHCGDWVRIEEIGADHNDRLVLRLSDGSELHRGRAYWMNSVRMRRDTRRD